MSKMIVSTIADKKIYGEDPNAYEQVQNRLKELSYNNSRYFSVAEICSGDACRVSQRVIKYILDGVSWSDGRCGGYKFKCSGVETEANSVVDVFSDSGLYSDANERLLIENLITETRKSPERFFSVAEIFAKISYQLTQMQIVSILDNAEWAEKNGKCYRINRDILLSETVEAVDLKHKHVFGEWKNVKEADCLEDGVQTRICAECGASEERVVPPLGHVYDQWETARTPSCEHDGVEIRRCKRCNYTDERAINRYEHKFGEWQIPDGQNCISAEYELRICEKCGYAEVKQNKRIDHSFGDWETFTKASCHAEGIEVRTCIDCGHTERKTLPKIPHEYNMWNVDVAPTCVADGVSVRKCVNCGASETKIIPMTGHKYGMWIAKLAPNCLEEGLEVRACECCGNTIEHKLSVLGHDFDRWIIDKTPSIGEKGQTSRKCKRCGFTETKTIAAIDEEKSETDRPKSSLGTCILTAQDGRKDSDDFSDGAPYDIDLRFHVNTSDEEIAKKLKIITNILLKRYADKQAVSLTAVVNENNDIPVSNINSMTKQLFGQTARQYLTEMNILAPQLSNQMTDEEKAEAERKELQSLIDTLSERYKNSCATSLTNIGIDNQDISISRLHVLTRKCFNQTASEYLIDKGILMVKSIPSTKVRIESAMQKIRADFSEKKATSLAELSGCDFGATLASLGNWVKSEYGCALYDYLVREGVLEPRKNAMKSIDERVKAVTEMYRKEQEEAIATYDKKTQLQIIVEAIDEFGGIAKYSEIYSKYEELTGTKLSYGQKAGIRKEIEINSADTKGKCKSTTFYSVGGIGSGCWGLVKSNEESTGSENSDCNEEKIVETDTDTGNNKTTASEINEAAVLRYMDSHFPDGTIYRGQYNIKFLTTYYFTAIYKLAKAEDLSMDKWLQQKGFIFKNIGYAEPDMCCVKSEYNSEDPYAIADYVFKSYPLAGLYMPSEAEEALLFKAAYAAVQKLVNKGKSLTEKEQVIITLETIELLKKWNPSGETEDSSGAFWPFIFLQYGLSFEQIGENRRQNVYTKFCKAIKSTFKKYNRFFAPDNTQKYYTTMLMHAISPLQSTEALFSILFDFYAKNLDLQYVEDDISFSTLVKYLGEKWSGTQGSDNELQIKSEVVCSGLKTLFVHRPEYMTTLCDGIVLRIEQTLKDEAEPAETYLDMLFDNWYEKRSLKVRNREKAERRRRGREFIATTEESIEVHYCMDLNSLAVGIEVLRIRLSDTSFRPKLSMYQCGRLIYNEEMSVTGNNLGLTTKRCFIDFNKTEYDFSSPTHIEIRIEQGEKCLYTSETKLNRDYLLLNDCGIEKQKRNSDIIYLFTSDEDKVNFGIDEGIYKFPTQHGQLYKVNINTAEAIFVNGGEIAVSEKAAKEVRIDANPKAVRSVQSVLQGKSFAVFSESPDIRVYLPENEPVHRYAVVFDGEKIPQEEPKECISIAERSRTNTYHSIQVIDNASRFMKCEYNYIIIPELSITLDKKYFTEADSEAGATIRIADKSCSVSGMLDLSTDTFSALCPINEISLTIDVPVIRCEFLGEDAFSSEKFIWYKDIPNTEFVQLKLPNGWIGEVYLGDMAVPHASTGKGYELGNVVHGGKAFSKEEPLTLLLHSEKGESIALHIADIVFTPKFVNPPIEECEGKMAWLPEDIYIGGKHDSFYVEIFSPEKVLISTFEADTKNADISVEAQLSSGRYLYVIYLIKKSVFSAAKQEKIYSGNLVVGNEYEFQYDYCELRLDKASYWNFESAEYQSSTIRDRAAIIADMVYVEHSTPNGYDEVGDMPKYSATLLYEKSNGLKMPFPNSYRNANGNECINPVCVWIVNEHTLIMQTNDGDAVYFNSDSRTILSKDPQLLKKQKLITPYVYKHNICNPDYFEYTIEEVKNV